MSNALIRKLEFGARLSDEDRAAVSRAIAETRKVGPRTDLVRQGDRPEYVHGVLSGYVCRYKTSPEGGRQIVALLLPGDFCDLHIHLLGTMDHSIATISASEIAILSRRVVDELIDSRPTVARALWWASLVDEGTLREWLLNLGRRPARQQMAHLFCELRARLDAIGLVHDDSYSFPLVQGELADLLGLSSVHANRTLQELRSERLVAFREGWLQILDRKRLETVAGFEPAYLHLDNGRAH